MANGAPTRDPRNAAVIRTETLGLLVDLAPSLADYVRLIPDRASARGRAFIATFVNPYSAMALRANAGLRAALDRFDLIAPDGLGVCFAARRLHNLATARASFDTTSLAPIVFGAACRYESTVALVGARPGIAAAAATRLKEAFPSLRIVATFDGYEGRAAALDTVPSLAPDIVVCGMGAGAQEEFLLALVERGWTGCGFTCGGYLDQLAVAYSYYPAWVDAANLRWAYRLFREPRRLWRRYLLDYGNFGLVFLKAVLKRWSGPPPICRHHGVGVLPTSSLPALHQTDAGRGRGAAIGCRPSTRAHLL